MSGLIEAVNDVFKTIQYTFSDAADSEARAFGIIILLIATLWIPGLLVTSRLSGWQRLARAYPRLDPLDGKKVNLGRAVVRSFGYGMIYVRSSATHLHVLARPPARFLGHPAFSVPWADVAVSRQPHWRYRHWTPVVCFRFARAPEVPLLMSAAAGARIASASAGRLHIPAAPEGLERSAHAGSM